MPDTFHESNQTKPKKNSSQKGPNQSSLPFILDPSIIDLESNPNRPGTRHSRPPHLSHIPRRHLHAPEQIRTRTHRRLQRPPAPHPLLNHHIFLLRQHERRRHALRLARRRHGERGRARARAEERHGLAFLAVLARVVGSRRGGTGGVCSLAFVECDSAV